MVDKFQDPLIDYPIIDPFTRWLARVKGEDLERLVAVSSVKTPLKKGQKVTDCYRTPTFIHKVAGSNMTFFTQEANGIPSYIYTHNLDWFVEDDKSSKLPPWGRMSFLEMLATESGKEFGQVGDEVFEAFEWLLVRAQRIHNIVSEHQRYGQQYRINPDVDDTRGRLSGEAPKATGIRFKIGGYGVCGCGEEILKPIEGAKDMGPCEECLREDKAEEAAERNSLHKDRTSRIPAQNSSDRHGDSDQMPKVAPHVSGAPRTQANSGLMSKHNWDSEHVSRQEAVLPPVRKQYLRQEQQLLLGPPESWHTESDTHDGTTGAPPGSGSDDIVLLVTEENGRAQKRRRTAQGIATARATVVQPKHPSIPLTAQARNQADFQNDLEPMRQIVKSYSEKEFGPLHQSMLDRLSELQDHHRHQMEAGNRGAQEDGAFRALLGRVMSEHNQRLPAPPVAVMLQRAKSTAIAAHFSTSATTDRQGAPTSSDHRRQFAVSTAASLGRQPHALAGSKRKVQLDGAGTNSKTDAPRANKKKGGNVGRLDHSHNVVPNMSTLSDSDFEARIFHDPGVRPDLLVGDAFLRLAKTHTPGDIATLYQPICIDKGWSMPERSNLQHRLKKAIAWKANGDNMVRLALPRPLARIQAMRCRLQRAISLLLPASLLLYSHTRWPCLPEEGPGREAAFPVWERVPLNMANRCSAAALSLPVATCTIRPTPRQTHIILQPLQYLDFLLAQARLSEHGKDLCGHI